MYHSFNKNKNIILESIPCKCPEKNTFIKKNVDCQMECVKCIFLNDAINYSYIYSIIPGKNTHVSIFNYSVIFYEFVEIFSNLKITPRRIGSFDERFKEYVDYAFNYELYSFLNIPNKMDLLFFELNENIMSVICFICKFQEKNGTVVLKVKSDVKRIELIYMLTTLYHNTIVTRPNVLPNNEDYIYIICQGYDNSYKPEISSFFSVPQTIYSKLPYSFIKFINEINCTIEQKILSFKKYIIHLDNDHEKVERLRTKNVYNCIKWCERHYIPHNESIKDII